MTGTTWRTMCATIAAAGLTATLAATPPALASDSNAFPSDADIRKIVAQRVQALGGEEGGVGIVVGVVTPQGRKVIAVGHLDKGDPRPLNGDTVFEIGSVTKAFTALLLVQMAEKGEVALNDPVGKHLPAGVKGPERNGRSITLLDLATHTSALPFMPELPPSGGSETTRAQLYRYLAGYQLPYDIGSKWEYSNLGYWLLGEALAARGGADYTSLMQARVFAPLGLKSTSFDLSPEMSARLAVGHDASLLQAPPFRSLPIYSAMPSAGGIHSTVNDLSKLVAVAMGNEPSPLSSAIGASVSTRRPGSRSGVEQALGWTVFQEGGELIFRDGGSFGHASCVVWDPARRIGVVVLSNQAASVADIARHLLRPDFPLEKPTATKRTEIALDAAALDRFVGRYEAQGEGTFAIVREGAFLTIEAPAEWGLPKLRLHPESPQDFFVSELPMRVTFESDGGGRVTGMLVYPPRGQKAVPAQRINPS